MRPPERTGATVYALRGSVFLSVSSGAKQTKTAFRSVSSSRLSVQAGARTSTEVRIMKKGRKMRPYIYGQTEEKGCRWRSFECEDEGVYNEVND